MFRLFLAAAGALLASCLYSRLRYLRSKQYAHIPQLPNHILWGHLETFGEFTSRGIRDRHPGKPWDGLPGAILLTKLCPQNLGMRRETATDIQTDTIFEEMWVSLGRPPVMLVDLRPIVPPMVLVPSHSMAEQIAKQSDLFPLSTPKSPTWTHMIPMIGETSILGKEVSVKAPYQVSLTDGYCASRVKTGRISANGIIQASRLSIYGLCYL